MASGIMRAHRVVLTGGPCAGKTTAQTKLAEFFEYLGWKVYRVPETATLLLNGGVKWPELSAEQAYRFQEDLLKTLLQVEQTFFNLAAGHGDRNVLVICDRGSYDPSAFVEPQEWDKMLRDNGWAAVTLRDQRYHHVVHMVSAANGAEEYYQVENNAARKEGIELARVLDQRASEAWVGHPYLDVVDNSTTFDLKINRVIQSVCQRLSIDVGDRLATGSRKRKFLLAKLPEVWPCKQVDFEVEHVYLLTTDGTQARIRRRGQGADSTFMHTVRHTPGSGARDRRVAISAHEFTSLLAQRDPAHLPVYKTRRCFLWKDCYFQLDMYQPPSHPRCAGLCLLELYTAQDKVVLPDFLEVVREVTDDPAFSMHALSLKD